MSKTSQHFRKHFSYDHHPFHEKKKSVLGSCQAATIMQNCIFFIKHSDFIIGNKYCRLFSLMWQTHFIFKKMSAGYLCLNTQFILFPRKSSVSWKKKLVDLKTQSQVLFLETTVLKDTEKCFMHPSCFCSQHIHGFITVSGTFLSLGMVAHICNPGIWEVEEEDLKFNWKWVSMDCMRPCLKKKPQELS